MAIFLSLFHISRTIYFSYDLCRNHNRNIFVAAADITKLQYNIRTMYVRQTYESYGVRKLDVRKKQNKLVARLSCGDRATAVQIVVIRNSVWRGFSLINITWRRYIKAFYK